MSGLREDWAYDCGCNSWSPLRDAVGSLKKELIRLWNSILPEPGQPSAQLSKLIRMTACKKTKHTVSRWYRTVYIPWFVSFYDTKRANVGWILNPPSHRGGNRMGDRKNRSENVNKTVKYYRFGRLYKSLVSKNKALILISFTELWRMNTNYCKSSIKNYFFNFLTA